MQDKHVVVVRYNEDRDKLINKLNNKLDNLEWATQKENIHQDSNLF